MTGSEDPVPEGVNIGIAEGNCAQGWFQENAEKYLCCLESPTDWPIQYFGIAVRPNLDQGPLVELSEVVWEREMCDLSKGLAKQANCAPPDEVVVRAQSACEFVWNPIPAVPSVPNCPSI